MPVDRGPAARRTGGRRRDTIPGLYQGTYERAVKAASEADPRLWPVETGWPTDPVEYQKFVDASPHAQAAKRRVEAMDRGEAIEVSAPGRGSPPAGIPWLEDDSVRTIMVASDDTVTPHQYRDR